MNRTRGERLRLSMERISPVRIWVSTSRDDESSRTRERSMKTSPSPVASSSPELNMLVTSSSAART